MSYSDMSYLLKIKLNNKKKELQDAISINKVIKSKKSELAELEKALNMCSDIVRKCQVVRTACENSYESFKRRRVDNFKSIVQSNIDYVFPEENYSVNLDFDPGIKNSSCELYFKTPSGHDVMPSINEGKMFQELVSFSSSISIVESTGKHKLYLDEAFAASDDSNLIKVSEIINMLVKNGFQIFLIEQKKSGYIDVPRREFTLKKNLLTKITSLVDYKDFGGETVGEDK